MSAVKGNTGARVRGDGLTAGEAEIMDLFDFGVRDRAEIATQTGYGINYVDQVIARYSVTDRVLNSYDKMVAAGSAALLAAIKCFHPNYEAML